MCFLQKNQTLEKFDIKLLNIYITNSKLVMDIQNINK